LGTVAEINRRSATMAEGWPQLGPAVASLFLRIALELLAGLWLGIHRDKAVEFFLSQVPMIGGRRGLVEFPPQETPKKISGVGSSGSSGRQWGGSGWHDGSRYCGISSLRRRGMIMSFSRWPKLHLPFH
jgi:hypothetical protein